MDLLEDAERTQPLWPEFSQALSSFTGDSPIEQDEGSHGEVVAPVSPFQLAPHRCAFVRLPVGFELVVGWN